MTWENVWDGLNVAARLGVMMIVIVKLTRFYTAYKPSERFGLGIAGGCSLLTVPVIIHGPGTPFDEWASAMFCIGVFIYFCGRVSRHVKHERGNAAAVRQAAHHLRQRALP